MIEVWRPGRPPEERRQRPARPQGERREHRPRPQSTVPAAPQDGAQAVAPPAGDTAAAATTDAPKPDRQDRRPRHGQDRAGQADRPQREGRPAARERRGGERPDREHSERSGRPPRREGGRRDFKDRDRGEAREWIDPKERRGQADPNSPFAKLAALKEQLEANKER